MSDCCFCESLQLHKQLVRENAKQFGTKARHVYTVALVERRFRPGVKGAFGRTTDYRYRGCGYRLNYCPECGRKLGRKQKEV